MQDDETESSEIKADIHKDFFVIPVHDIFAIHHREKGTGVPSGLQNRQQMDKTLCGRFDPCSLC
jgi:hypothetical protein